MSYEAVLSEIRTWSPEDQARLYEELKASLENGECDDGFVMTDELARELDRRRALADAHPERLIPWEEVKARLDARYGR